MISSKINGMFCTAVTASISSSSFYKVHLKHTVMLLHMHILVSDGMSATTVSSAIPVPDKFLKPFYKFHLSQLNGAAAGRAEGEWLVPVSGGGSVAACMVWLQGSVTQLNLAEDSLVLEEEGGGQAWV